MRSSSQQNLRNPVDGKKNDNGDTQTDKIGYDEVEEDGDLHSEYVTKKKPG